MRSLTAKRRAAAVGAFASLMLALAGCGSLSGSVGNETTQPAPLTSSSSVAPSQSSPPPPPTTPNPSAASAYSAAARRAARAASARSSAASAAASKSAATAQRAAARRAAKKKAAARRARAAASAAAQSSAADQPTSCHPLTNGGNCYEPGEFCRQSDAGTSGVAGDGEAITCEDNNGLRWEPS